MKKLAFLLLLSLVPVRRVKAGITKGQATAVAVVAVGGAYYALHSWASNTENLFEAVINGEYWKTRILIAAGANLEATDRDGRTPLHLAAEYGKTETAALFLDRGARLEATDRNGQTALHLAVQRGHRKITALLLDRGANLEATDQHGQTALHWTALNGKTETASLLLDRGASLEATDRDGLTPLHLAAYRGPIETVRLLLDRGASLEATDSDGRTALHRTAYRGPVETVRLFLVYGAQPRNINSQIPQINTMLQRYRGEQTEVEQTLYSVPGSLKQIAAISQLRTLYKEHNTNLEAVRSAINNLLISRDLKNTLLYWLGDPIQA